MDSSSSSNDIIINVTDHEHQYVSDDNPGKKSLNDQFKLFKLNRSIEYIYDHKVIHKKENAKYIINVETKNNEYIQIDIGNLLETYIMKTGSSQKVREVGMKWLTEGYAAEKQKTSIIEYIKNNIFTSIQTAIAIPTAFLWISDLKSKWDEYFKTVRNVEGCKILKNKIKNTERLLDDSNKFKDQPLQNQYTNERRKLRRSYNENDCEDIFANNPDSSCIWEFFYGFLKFLCFEQIPRVVGIWAVSEMWKWTDKEKTELLKNSWKDYSLMLIASNNPLTFMTTGPIFQIITTFFNNYAIGYLTLFFLNIVVGGVTAYGYISENQSKRQKKIDLKNALVGNVREKLHEIVSNSADIFINEDKNNDYIVYKNKNHSEEATEFNTRIDSMFTNLEYFEGGKETCKIINIKEVNKKIIIDLQSLYSEDNNMFNMKFIENFQKIEIGISSSTNIVYKNLSIAFHFFKELLNSYMKTPNCFNNVQKFWLYRWMGPKCSRYINQFNDQNRNSEFITFIGKACNQRLNILKTLITSNYLFLFVPYEDIDKMVKNKIFDGDFECVKYQIDNDDFTGKGFLLLSRTCPGKLHIIGISSQGSYVNRDFSIDDLKEFEEQEKNNNTFNNEVECILNYIDKKCLIKELIMNICWRNIKCKTSNNNEISTFMLSNNSQQEELNYARSIASFYRQVYKGKEEFKEFPKYYFVRSDNIRQDFESDLKRYNSMAFSSTYEGKDQERYDNDFKVIFQAYLINEYNKETEWNTFTENYNSIINKLQINVKINHYCVRPCYCVDEENKTWFGDYWFMAQKFDVNINKINMFHELNEFVEKYFNDLKTAKKMYTNYNQFKDMLYSRRWCSKCVETHEYVGQAIIPRLERKRARDETYSHSQSNQ
jgi:hypothetical protein